MTHAYNRVTPHLRIATWQNEDGHINTYYTFWGHSKDYPCNLEAPRDTKRKKYSKDLSIVNSVKKQRTELAAVLSSKESTLLDWKRTEKRNSFWLTTSSCEASFQSNIFSRGLTSQWENVAIQFFNPTC